MRALIAVSLGLMSCVPWKMTGLPLANGAGAIFSRASFCPAERVTVTPRPDIPPSTLVDAVSSPPPDVAADPQRLQMWRDSLAEQNTATNQWGKTYEVSGCGRSQQYVCGHPNRPDFIAGGALIAGDGTQNVSDGTPQGTVVVSAVQCLPRSQFDADAVPIPEHTEVPPLPVPIRALTVNAIPRSVGSDLRPLPAPISAQLESQCKASARRSCESFGWRVVDDDSADLQAIVPCVGTLDAQGKPEHIVESWQSDTTVELRWPPTSIASLELRAHETPIATVPVGPLHLRCELPRSADRVGSCEARWDEWDSARIARLLAASPALAAFASEHAH